MSAWRTRIVGHDSVDPRTLTGNPKNHRTHPQAQRDVVRDSIAELGFVKSVLVNKTTGYVIDGHERLWQALNAVETDPSVTIDVEYVELSEAEEAKALAVLDASTDMAIVDPVKLDELLRDFETGSEALSQMLSDLAEDAGCLDLNVDEVEDVEPEIDRADELMKEWGTAEGQLWIIEGKQTHRLLCGDSTKAESVSKLLGDAKPFIMVTDPPYGVDYAALVKSRGNQKKGGWDDIASDNLSSGDLKMLLVGALSCPTAKVAFVWHPPGAMRCSFWSALEENGWKISQEIVWVKNALVFGRADYQWRHEPCMYAKREGAGRQEDRTQTTVWQIDKQSNAEHPTQKPIECMARPIRNHGGKGDDVYDPFIGSGTTMLAAEQLNRKCYGMEISPKYCAVILQRMKTAGCECRLEDLKK